MSSTDITVQVANGSTVAPSVTNGDAVNVTYTTAGDRGPKGDTGPANTLTIGTVTSGETASATITGTAPSQTLNLVLQQGPAGSVGATGSQGDTGPAGPPNSLSIGTVTSGASASASITGTAPTQTLSLVLPVGATGPAGPQGATGATGPAGSTNLSDETPQPLGTASAGTALAAARADHIHAVPTLAYSSLSGIPSTFAPSAHQHVIADTTGLQAALDAKCPLVNNLVPSANLPSYVDDVIDVGGTLPASGDVGKIYVVSTGTNVNKIYRWSGSAFIEISPSPGSTDAVPEGSTNLYHTTKRASDAAPVQSVAGRTGTVTLTAADVSGVVSGVNKITGGVTLAAGSNVTLSEAGSTITISSDAAPYTLPTATDSVLGGVKVGSGLKISSGVLSLSSTYNPAAAPGPPSAIGVSANYLYVSWTASPGGVAVVYEVQLTLDFGATYSTVASNVSGTGLYLSSGSNTARYRVRGFNADNLPGEWGYQEGLLPGSGSGSSSLVYAATPAGFPGTGSTDNLYISTDTQRVYRWDATNSVYVELGSGA